MAEAFVEVDDVDLAYDEVSGNAIEDVSLSMQEHEFIAMVGPSGCGKSTFMKLCSGLRPPTKGHVAVDGREVSGPERMIFSHWNGAVSVRTQQYRLDATGRLYDMVKDPGQQRDLAREEPDTARRLSEAVASWKRLPDSGEFINMINTFS